LQTEAGRRPPSASTSHQICKVKGGAPPMFRNAALSNLVRKLQAFTRPPGKTAPHRVGRRPQTAAEVRPLSPPNLRPPGRPPNQPSARPRRNLSFPPRNYPATPPAPPAVFGPGASQSSRRCVARPATAKSTFRKPPPGGGFEAENHNSPRMSERFQKTSVSTVQSPGRLTSLAGHTH